MVAYCVLMFVSFGFALTAPTVAEGHIWMNLVLLSGIVEVNLFAIGVAMDRQE